MEKAKTCAVFGANGYLGSHLAIYLKNLGYNVDSYDIQLSSSLENYHRLDITDKEALKNIDWDIDFLYFFSGLTGTGVGFDKFNAFVQVNEIGLLNVLDELKNRIKKPHIVFPSTRLVYKGADHPLKEDDEKKPLTIYAVNKLACEEYLNIYYNQFGIPYSVFRICVPYGSFISKIYSYGTIGFFLGKAIKGEDITLYGDGALKRTFTNVKDICFQITVCIKDKSSVGQIFNIGGETFSLEEVAKVFAEKYAVAVNHITWPENDLRIESGDTIFDDNKIKTVIGESSGILMKEFVKNL